MSKVKLCDICDFQGGSQPPKSQWITLQQDGYIRMLQIRDFTQPGKVKAEYVKLTNTTKWCLKDDILIARYGASLGKILTGLSGAYNVAMTKAVPNEAVISKKFLYYFLCSDTFQNCILNVGVRAAQAGFNKEDLSNIEIYCPDLSVQNKICKILELVDILINKSKLQLDELDLLVKSRFIEMFHNKGYPIKDIESISFNKGEYGAQSASSEYDSNRPRYVRITDINDDGTLNDDFVSSSNLKDDDTYRLKYGDFLFARMGATVGKTYAFKSGNLIFAGYLIKFALKTDIVLPEYLFAYTKTNEYLSWVKNNQSGAAQPGINAKKYGSLRLPIPPIGLQNQFADFVAQVDKSKLAIQQSLDELETLKKSLMQQYFG